MFTGLIEEVGSVSRVTEERGTTRLIIESRLAPQLQVDQSISVQGVCLTVTDQKEKKFTIQCVDETLKKTTLGNLQEGDPVNLERSLTLQKRIDGHLVQGHVDRVGEIRDIRRRKDNRWITIRYPSNDKDLVIPRGSIAVDGISLTVAELSAPSLLTVAVIPYTHEHTSLKNRKEGDPVNLEYDMMGKYVVRYLRQRQQN